MTNNAYPTLTPASVGAARHRRVHRTMLPHPTEVLSTFPGYLEARETAARLEDYQPTPVEPPQDSFAVMIGVAVAAAQNGQPLPTTAELISAAAPDREQWMRDAEV